jgi:hypothetical protein
MKVDLHWFMVRRLARSKRSLEDIGRAVRGFWETYDDDDDDDEQTSNEEMKGVYRSSSACTQPRRHHRLLGFIDGRPLSLRCPPSPQSFLSPQRPSPPSAFASHGHTPSTQPPPQGLPSSLYFHGLVTTDLGGQRPFITTASAAPENHALIHQAQGLHRAKSVSYAAGGHGEFV